MIQRNDMPYYLELLFSDTAKYDFDGKSIPLDSDPGKMISCSL